MIAFAPIDFHDFLRQLFIVNDATMAFWHGDDPVTYEDRVRRWNEVVNQSYLQWTNDIEAQEYFNSFPVVDRIRVHGRITSVEKFIKIYNCHIKNSEFTCKNIFGNFHIEFIVQDIYEMGLCFQCIIEVDKLVDYFKNHILNIVQVPVRKEKAEGCSRFEIMEIV